MPRRSATSTVARAAPVAAPRPTAARPQERATRPADIGGFRLVRRLDDDGEVSTWVARGADEAVVLRVFRETAADARIDAETLARERLIGPCSPELVDIATTSTGRPALVVRAVIGPTLDEVLQRLEGPLRAGHLTTLLAPLAALIAAAHETGATLGRLDARGIRIDASGRPVVVALGRAAAAAPLPERFRSQEPGIVADRAQLDELARALAARVDPRERASVESALATGAGCPERLEIALFDCAAPLPVIELVSGSSRVRQAEPERVDDRAARVSERFQPPMTVDPTETRGHEKSGAPGALEELGRRLGLPSDLLAPLDEARRRGSALLKRGVVTGRALVSRRSSAAPPRRPVIIVGALGLLCLGAAVAISAAESPSADGFTSSAGAEPRDSAPAEPAPAPASSGDFPADAAVPPGAADLPESLSEPTADEWAPLVSALVDRWLACADDPGPACADSVAQAESAASDQLLGPPEGRVYARETLSSWVGGARDSVVVDRHGGAVVVDLVDGETTTASLLMMRSEAGWRVRAVLLSGSS